MINGIMQDTFDLHKMFSLDISEKIVGKKLQKRRKNLPRKKPKQI